MSAGTMMVMCSVVAKASSASANVVENVRGSEVVVRVACTVLEGQRNRWSMPCVRL